MVINLRGRGENSWSGLDHWKGFGGRIHPRYARKPELVEDVIAVSDASLVLSDPSLVLSDPSLVLSLFLAPSSVFLGIVKHPLHHYLEELVIVV